MTTEDTESAIPPPSSASAESYAGFLKLREIESKHLRKWDGFHSVVLYVAVLAVIALGVVLVRDLILPTWTSLPILPTQDENALNRLPELPSEVWIAILTAPLLAVSGLAWATFHALSGKKNLPAINAKAFATLEPSKEEDPS